MSVKSILRQLFFPPLLPACAYDATSNEYKTWLDSAGIRTDVTGLTCIASLQPLTIALGVAANENATLLFFKGNRRLGHLLLKPTGAISHHAGNINLFEVAGGKNNVLSPIGSLVANLRIWLAGRKAKAGSFTMTSQDLRHFHIYYGIPRPVVLVTTAHSKIPCFPMDLIGKMPGNVFTLALRNTSQAINALHSSRQVCVSKIAPEQKDLAYRLGKHHTSSASENISYPTIKSQHHGLSVPAFSLQVTELEITDHRIIGSHTLFVCNIINASSNNTGMQLAHQSWFMKPMVC